MHRFDYRLFGLHIRSELELPELPQGDAWSEPQVLIRRDESDAGDAQIAIPGVARFTIVDGREIRVRAEPGASGRNVRLYLLGSAMGMLLHQRGLLPLHANAVEIDGEAVAFMGPSGSGKSTIAAWFHDLGHRILADDVCVVDFEEDGRPIVSTGLPRLRLWDDVLAATGRQEGQFERSFAGDVDYRKYDVPIPPDMTGDGLPLAAIYLLDRGDEVSVTALRGVEAVEAVFANTYRGGYVRGTGQSRTHWQACLRLVGEVPVFTLVRRWGHELLREQIEQVLAHARSSIVRPRR